MLDFTKLRAEPFRVILPDKTKICLNVLKVKHERQIRAALEVCTGITDNEMLSVISDILSDNKEKKPITKEYIEENISPAELNMLVKKILEWGRGIESDPN